VPVHDIRIAGRNTQGVTLFKVGDEENIVSVDRIQEAEDDEEEGEENEEGNGEADNDTAENDTSSEASDEDTNPEE
jgi:DNA gyrase subunit A